MLELEEGTEIVDKQEGALPLQENDNERLEFLGDSVLNPTVANYLFHRFPDENEGFYTRVKNRLVCGEALGQFAQEMGFSEYMIISRHIEDKCNGRFSIKLLEDCFRLLWVRFIWISTIFQKVLVNIKNFQISQIHLILE